MKKGNGKKDDATLLRQKAETAVAKLPPESDIGMDLARANHELRVHQIELEMQNEELHRSQIALEVSRDRYRDLYEFAPLGYFTLDAELNIIELNLTGADILGRTRPELMGKAFRDFVETQDLYIWIRHVDVVRRGLGGGDFEIALHRPDGKLVHVYLHRVMMSPEGGRESMLMAVSDVGDRWSAEKKAKESGRKLEMLASITRHDLLNQTIILRGFLELSERKEDTDEAKELRQRAANAAKNIEEIVDFTNRYQELGKQEPVWTEIRSEVDKNCRGIAMNQLELKNELDSVFVLADPMIGKVFYNLVDNCIRHVSGATYIRFRAYVEMGKLLIICENDGPGIPNDSKEMIFERGYGSHTGQGLFFAREILALTNIHIEERGYPNEGAKFVMTVLEQNWRDRLGPA